MKLAAVGVFAAWLAAGEDTIPIENFASPKYTWRAYNDPVMGGRSTSSVTMEDGVMHLKGEVKNLPPPFPALPGFVQAKASDTNDWPDLSDCKGLGLTLKSMTEYERFFVSFGYSKPPEGKRYAWGHKAQMFEAPRDEFAKVEIDFNQFTNYWEDSTGDTIVSCEENSKYCPTAAELVNLRTLAIWGEGEAGPVDIEVKEIHAYGCGGAGGDDENDDRMDGTCGHDGFNLKSKSKLSKFKNVENACRCENMCMTMDGAEAWSYKKENGKCQCLRLDGKGKRPYRVRKSKRFTASHNA